MSRIQKVDLNVGQKIINPFKTSRSSAVTNPFKYSNFEGNTLQFADVFEGFENKKTSKLKMITSSVAGSMTKIRTSITEPIKTFVNRIKNSMSNAWEYAKNTNIELPEIPALKNVSERINSTLQMDIADIGKSIGNSISGRVSHINSNLTEIGKTMSAEWSKLLGKLNGNKITSETSVDELRKMWEAEIAIAKEAA